MIAIVDYDAGNIKSVEKAFAYLGQKTAVTRKREEILSAEGVVLPGVGSFGDAMEKLNSYELSDVIRECIRRKTPFLGICMGLQLLFGSSEESPGVDGLGIMPGKIVRIPDGDGLKVPHIGWNSLSFPRKTRLFEGIEENSFLYFVHSYYLCADDPSIVAATADYGVRIHAAVEWENLFACQFHPEKSSETGLHILKNFISITEHWKSRK